MKNLRKKKIRVNAVNIASEWKRFEKNIQGVVDLMYGLYTIEDILENVINGEYEFWTTTDSALITAVQVYPRKSVLHLFVACGNLEELQQLYLEAEEYARDKGCEYITILGRAGWERSFLTTDHGFKVMCSELIKEL